LYIFLHGLSQNILKYNIVIWFLKSCANQSIFNTYLIYGDEVDQVHTLQFYCHLLSKMVSPKFTQANSYCFMVYQFLGLAVFKLDINYNPVGNLISKLINIGIGFLVVMDYFIGVKIGKALPRNVDFMRQIQDGSMYMLRFFTQLTMVVEAFYKNSVYIKILTTINQIDEDLEQFLSERRGFDSKVRMDKWWDNLKLLILFSTFVIQQLLSVTVFVEADLYFLFWVHLLPSNFFIYVTVIQIVFIVNAIAQRVSFINQILALIDRDLEDVEILRLLIVKLKKTANRVSCCFGWTMVAIVFQNFISIAGDIFFSILHKLEPTSYLYPFGELSLS
jgi:7tm Chemosensory receptor